MLVRCKEYSSDCCMGCEIAKEPSHTYIKCRSCEDNLGCVNCFYKRACEFAHYDNRTTNLEISVCYHDCDPYIQKIKVGDWIDLRASKSYVLADGEYAQIDLGVSMKLPKGYEAIIAPRSSLFKNHWLIQTNSIGVIDNSFSGMGDIWVMPVYCFHHTKIVKGERIAQFRIIKNQPHFDFNTVKCLDTQNRCGLGSTGRY